MSNAPLRPAVFAAQGWYPADPTSLRAFLRHVVSSPANSPELPCRLAIAPHAGYVYSGSVAGALYGRIRVPDRVVLLHVNHRGLGAPLAVWAHGGWEIPGAVVPIDEPLAVALVRGIPLLVEDTEAHLREHSGELQVPFLHFRNEHVRIVPISVGALGLDDALAVGDALAEVLAAHAPDALIVASTDFNHYEDQETTRVKDELAIGRILALDPAGLYQTVRRAAVSMCGVVPVTIGLQAALRLGATRATLVARATSGDVTGDYAAVVGYASIAVA